MSPNLPHLTWPMPAPPMAMLCECGLVMVFAVERSITDPGARHDLMHQAAAALRWRLVEKQWLCPCCFAGRVHQAALQSRVGTNLLMLAVDRAEKERARDLRIKAVGL